jgi:flagellar motor switch protein FliM
MGRVGDRVAVRVGKPLRRSRTTLAMFEGTDTATTNTPPNRREMP